MRCASRWSDSASANLRGGGRRTGLGCFRLNAVLLVEACRASTSTQRHDVAPLPAYVPTRPVIQRWHHGPASGRSVSGFGVFIVISGEACVSTLPP